MSFVSGLLGGSTGAGFQAVAPSSQQLNQANNQVTGSIKQQQDFVNALQGQNGLGNQSAVFGQQQGLANQLQGVAAGTGPNPAQAALNQATGRNVQTQAALMAGQRGSSANAGLMARQAAMQGANTQQQAIGQGATLQAQQQLAGMQQLAQQQANMANMANTQVGQQQAGLTGLNQNTLQNQANLYGLQSNANSANASIAGTNAGSQANIMGGMMGGIGSAMNMIGGSGGGAAGGSSAIGGIGQGSAAIDNGASLQDLSDIGFASGGRVRMADGGSPEDFDPLMQTPQSTPQVQSMDQPKTQGPQSNVAKMFSDAGPQAKAGVNKPSAGASSMTSGMLNLGVKAIEGIGKNQLVQGLTNSLGDMFGAVGSGAGETVAGGGDAIAGGAAGVETAAPEIAMAAAHGGKVPALVSPGEIRIPKRDVKKVAEGKKSPLSGEKIPGKPKVGGAKNSYANDTVRKTLNEGDIILPRSVTQAKHPHWAAHAFMRQVMAGKHRK